MAEDTPDAWGELNARYRHSSDDQFLLVADQLAEIRELLLSGSMAKLRLALVGVDNLADVLLVRHLQRIDEIAEYSRRALVPRLDAQKRRRFRGDFSFRVELGLQGATDSWFSRSLSPVLESLDATIFRTSHEYRNRVYHADHHNDTVLPIVARLYMAAVCRAWIRQQSTRSASTMSRGFRRRLDAHGYDDAERSLGEFGADYFAPAHAAESIGRRLSDDLQPELGALRGRAYSTDGMMV